MNKLNKKITDELKLNKQDVDQKNNRHLINFLSTKSEKFAAFKTRLIRTDLNSNWEEFFEFVSILRNVIAHHDMIITKNIHNELKKNCKLLFERHFKLIKDENDQNILFFEKKSMASNLLNLYSDFGINAVKFIYEENDLSFIGFHKL